MSVSSATTGTAPALIGSEGELVLLHISIEPKLLEDLLEVLARLDFPVNPELHHKPNSVTVEFPAWSAKVDGVCNLLKMYGFDPHWLEIGRPLIAHA
jgi:hypothetical protein